MDPDSDSSDEAAFVALGETLRRELGRAMPAWVRKTIAIRLPPGSPTPSDAEHARITDVTADVVERVDERMRALIAADIEEPLSGPLEIVRQSTGPLTELLDEMGAEPRERDPFDIRARPDDRFDIGPMSFLELGEAVHDAGIGWGAGKAFLHKSRRVGRPPE